MKLMGLKSGVVGVALVLEKLGGGAGRRSNGKCRDKRHRARRRGRLLYTRPQFIRGTEGLHP